MTGQEEREDGQIGGIVSRASGRKRRLTFMWTGAMIGQEERKADLTGGKGS
jgi:hypothetical protein